MTLKKKAINEVKLPDAVQDVCDILNRVRTIETKKSEYKPIGIEELDMSFLLVRNEVEYSRAYVKTESGYKVFNSLFNDISKYHRSFLTASPNTSDIYMLDNIIMDVYMFLFENNMNTLDMVYQSEHTYTKLSRVTVGYGMLPPIVEKTVKAIKYIDEMIADIISDERNAVDMHSGKQYEEHDFMGTVYYEEKPSDNVFSSNYYALTHIDENGKPVITKESYHSVFTDIETMESWSIISKDCGFTVNESAFMLLFFVHNLPIESCRKTYGCGTTPRQRVKKYIASGLDKYMSRYGNIEMTADAWERIADIGLLDMMKEKIPVVSGIVRKKADMQYDEHCKAKKQHEAVLASQWCKFDGIHSIDCGYSEKNLPDVSETKVKSVNKKWYSSAFIIG